MRPIEWRLAKALTLDDAARRAGVSGVNPGRTYQRYECGLRAAPADVVEAIRVASEGDVGPSDWHDVRIAFLSDGTHISEQAA